MTDHTIPKGQLWTGRILSGLVVAFMLFDAAGKFMKPEPVVKGTLELGFAEHHIVTLGILGLVSALLYAIPRTAVLGAILLTAYFGGAVATHVRLDNPLFTHTLFTVYFGILAWLGLWLRDVRVRALLPFS